MYSSYRQRSSKISQNYAIKYNFENSFKFGIINAFIQYDEKIYILIQKLHRSCNFLENFANNNHRALKFNNFYFIGVLESDFHIITKDNILDKCILIENSNDEFFLSTLVDHNDN